MDIKQYLSDYKKLIDKAVEEYFSREVSCSEKLKEAMLYSLRAGGKRLRPILCMASAEACGVAVPLSPTGRGKGEGVLVSDGVLSIALALEMIHTFSLIHDDLPAMDDDDLRRGLPTSHKKFGEAVAILAGDALLAEAFRCLSQGSVGAALSGRPNMAGTEPRHYGNILEIISDIAAATGAKGMTGGQVLDLEAEGKKISYEELRNIHKGKTGALITVSVTSGAKAVSANRRQAAALEEYGNAIGLAFQITDDILDVTATTEELGKPAKSDIENEKSTYPAILGIEKSKKLAKEQIDIAYSALAGLGTKADSLREIARYIISRKS